MSVHSACHQSKILTATEIQFQSKSALLVKPEQTGSLSKGDNMERGKKDREWFVNVRMRRADKAK